MSEQIGVGPIVVHFTVNMDRFTLELEPQPRFFPIDINEILNVRYGECTLCHFDQPFLDPCKGSVIFNAFHIKASQTIAMRCPRWTFLGHPETNQGHIVTWFAQSVPAPTRFEVGDTKWRTQFEPTFGQGGQLLLDR